MIIYFIQEEPNGAVKIGQTNNVIKRMSSLQTGCSRQLKVLYCFEVPDDKANYAEQHIHFCFRNRRMKGEWFSPCPYLFDYIKSIEEHGFFVDWKAATEEEVSSNSANDDLYNKTFHHIEETKKYGDIRQIESLAENLEELLRYAKSGR